MADKPPKSPPRLNYAAPPSHDPPSPSGERRAVPRPGPPAAPIPTPLDIAEPKKPSLDTETVLNNAELSGYGYRNSGERPSEKTSVVESHEVHPSGIIGTLLKKHFSWENLVVLLVGDGIGLSLCIAAGDAALRKDWGPMFAGFGIGLPLMAIATSFPFWKNRVAKLLRDSVVHVATGGFAIILLAAVVYVLGPYLLPKTAEPSAEDIAAAVARNLQGNGAPQTKAPANEPNYVKNIQFDWDSQRPLSVLAFAATSGEKLKIVMQNFEFTPTPQGNFFPLYPSIVLDEFGSVVEGQRIESKIISLASSSTKDNETFVFGDPNGDPTHNYIISPGLHLIRLFFLMGTSSEPQNYKFAFIANRDPHNRFTVFWPHMLDDIEKWRRQ
jgi:hypothetical protein